MAKIDFLDFAHLRLGPGIQEISSDQVPPTETANGVYQIFEICPLSQDGNNNTCISVAEKRLFVPVPHEYLYSLQLTSSAKLVGFWFLDKVTRETEIEGETWGLPWGGAPIKLKLAVEDLNLSYDSVRAAYKQLKDYGFIRELRRTPYGFLVQVRYSRKNLKESKKKSNSPSSESGDISNSLKTESGNPLQRVGKNHTESWEIPDYKEDKTKTKQILNKKELYFLNELLEAARNLPGWQPEEDDETLLLQLLNNYNFATVQRKIQELAQWQQGNKPYPPEDLKLKLEQWTYNHVQKFGLEPDREPLLLDDHIVTDRNEFQKLIDDKRVKLIAPRQWQTVTQETLEPQNETDISEWKKRFHEAINGKGVKHER